jgi:hypothetical protein
MFFAKLFLGTILWFTMTYFFGPGFLDKFNKILIFRI